MSFFLAFWHFTFVFVSRPIWQSEPFPLLPLSSPVQCGHTLPVCCQLLSYFSFHSIWDEFSCALVYLCPFCLLPMIICHLFMSCLCLCSLWSKGGDSRLTSILLFAPSSNPLGFFSYCHWSFVIHICSLWSRGGDGLFNLSFICPKPLQHPPFALIGHSPQILPRLNLLSNIFLARTLYDYHPVIQLSINCMIIIIIIQIHNPQYDYHYPHRGTRRSRRWCTYAICNIIVTSKQILWFPGISISGFEVSRCPFTLHNTNQMWFYP